MTIHFSLWPAFYRPFVAAIIEQPHNTAARLIFADYLDEQGDPFGEFIRCQIKMSTCRMCVGKRRKSGYSEHCGRCKPLRCREAALLAYLEPRLLSYYPPDAVRWRAKDVGWDRGFLGKFSCTAPEWLSIGPQIVAAAPCVIVEWTDKRPEWIDPKRIDLPKGKPWTWFEDFGNNYSSPHHLPTEIFRLLSDRYFTTEDDARSALSKAAIQWARQVLTSHPKK